MKLKKIAIYALLTGGLSLPVMTSGIALSYAANGTAKGATLVTFSPEQPEGPWKATQISAEKSKHPYCSVEARFTQAGATLVLARNKKGLNSLAMDFGKPIFEKGQTYELMIGTDIGLERRYEARALTTSLLMAQVGDDKPFIRAVSYDGDFTFFVPDQVRAQFTLAGAKDALERLDRCLTTLEDFIPPLADETYLREARASAVKKHPTAGNGLVVERGPSRTASARVAQNTAPKHVPVPPRKASAMTIKVTKVEAPVVYEEPKADATQVAENDTIAQPDLVEIAREEISQKIDELAAATPDGTEPGKAEEHADYSEKVVKMARKEPLPKTEPKAEETPADEAKVEETKTAEADPKAEETTPVETEVDEATPPSADDLMTPMPNEKHMDVNGKHIVIRVHKPGEEDAKVASAKAKTAPIDWKGDRAEIKDPAAKNIMALAKRDPAGEEPVAVKAASVEAAPTQANPVPTNPVQTADAGKTGFLPPPDLSMDMPEDGAYFPEQTATLDKADIEKAITVKVEKPAAAPVAEKTAPQNTPVKDGTQLASLQEASPFDPAEYQRLKQLAQKKHEQEIAAEKPAEAAPVAAEPINLMSDTASDIADIATAAGEDMETAAMMPEPMALTAPAVATSEPVELSFSTTAPLTRADYMAMKKKATQALAETLKTADVQTTSLSDAINLLVPAQYQITVGNGVDMNRRVSWKKGDNWQDTIAEVLGPIGVEARVKGSVVMLMSMAQ